jgi:hypothetical protein
LTMGPWQSLRTGAEQLDKGSFRVKSKPQQS